MSGVEAAAAQVQEAVAAGTEQAIAAAQAEEQREAAIASAQDTASIALGAVADAARETGDLAGRLANLETEFGSWRNQGEEATANLRAELTTLRDEIQATIAASLSSLNQPPPATATAATVEVQAATPAESDPPADSQASDAPILPQGREPATGFRSRILRRSGRG